MELKVARHGAEIAHLNRRVVSHYGLARPGLGLLHALLALLPPSAHQALVEQLGRLQDGFRSGQQAQLEAERAAGGCGVAITVAAQDVEDAGLARNHLGQSTSAQLRLAHIGITRGEVQDERTSLDRLAVDGDRHAVHPAHCRAPLQMVSPIAQIHGIARHTPVRIIALRHDAGAAHLALVAHPVEGAHHTMAARLLVLPARLHVFLGPHLARQRQRVGRQRRGHRTRRPCRHRQGEGRSGQLDALVAQRHVQLVRATARNGVVHAVDLDQLPVRMQPARLNAAKGKPDAPRIRFEFIVVDRLAVPINVHLLDLLLLLESKGLGFLMRDAISRSSKAIKKQ